MVKSTSTGERELNKNVFTQKRGDPQNKSIYYTGRKVPRSAETPLWNGEIYNSSTFLRNHGFYF